MRPSGLSTPSALSRRGVEEKKIKNRARARARGVLGLVIDAVRTETVHGLRNDQGMPVFTPGSNPRRLPAAACRRGSWFLSSSRGDGSRRRRRAARRGGAARGRTSVFPSRSLFAFATLTFARHLLERGEGKAETVRRARGTVSTPARSAKKQKTKNKKQKTNARGVRRGQDRNESQAA